MNPGGVISSTQPTESVKTSQFPDCERLIGPSEDNIFHMPRTCSAHRTSQAVYSMRFYHNKEHKWVPTGSKNTKILFHI